MKKISRLQSLSYAKNMLAKAKSSFKAIVMDQDGTIKGGDEPKYKKVNVVELLQRIAEAGKYPVILTASGASALKSFATLTEFYFQKQNENSTFIGIGNGTALYQFNKNGREEVYNHCLSLKEAKAIVKVWQYKYAELGIKDSDLQAKGMEIFKGFMEKDWTGYIPKKYVELFTPFGGKCFTEQIKVTVVFPTWEADRQRELVKQMQAVLDQQLGANKYLASRGDDTFLHITHAFEIDPKLFALQTVMKSLKLEKHNIIAIGDLPQDNDKGILIDSGLPYTFTNRWFEKKDLQKPPFILTVSSESDIGSVYKALEYLLIK